MAKVSQGSPKFRNCVRINVASLRPKCASPDVLSCICIYIHVYTYTPVEGLAHVAALCATPPQYLQHHECDWIHRDRESPCASVMQGAEARESYVCPLSPHLAAFGLGPALHGLAFFIYVCSLVVRRDLQAYEYVNIQWLNPMYTAPCPSRTSSCMLFWRRPTKRFTDMVGKEFDMMGPI